MQENSTTVCTSNNATMEPMKERQPGTRKEHHKKIVKTPKETLVALIVAASKKGTSSLDICLSLSFLSGIFVSLFGTASLYVSQGMPNSDAGIKKLVLGIIFAITLPYIALTGGELFTGNTMTMWLGLLHGHINTISLLVNWSVSLLGNSLGALTGAYFFAYLTEVFSEDPWKTGVQSVAILKVETYGIGATLLRAIAANILVCTATWSSTTAEDVTGKIMGSLLPVLCFSASGFEHSVANMYFVPVGLLYGSHTTVARFIYKNFLIVVLGNTIGGVSFATLLYWSYRKNLVVKGAIPYSSSAKEKLVSFSCLFPADSEL